jgi:putative transposase
MTKEKKETKCDDLIDALLEEHGISQEAVLGENGLIAQLKKRVVERALAGELTLILATPKAKRPKRSTTIATATARRQWLGKTEQ